MPVWRGLVLRPPGAQDFKMASSGPQNLSVLIVGAGENPVIKDYPRGRFQTSDFSQALQGSSLLKA
jgi:hypothetical protein